MNPERGENNGNDIIHRFICIIALSSLWLINLAFDLFLK